MDNNTLPAFARFIEDLRAVWARLPDDESRMKEGQRLLKALLSDAELIAHARNWPSTEGRKNLLFYEDPDYGFAINGVVRLPGRTGSVHDHDRAWVAYGLLEGSETLERFDRLDDGSKHGYAEVKRTSANTGQAGDVDLVEPFAIHAEQGGPARSVAVILRSVRVAGRVLQGGYEPDRNIYEKREGPEQIPYALNG
jgi:predicted metal-dependent enzyme (double-stranded beta helix superfamily)